MTALEGQFSRSVALILARIVLYTWGMVMIWSRIVRNSYGGSVEVRYGSP
jgi:hypothetical protein